MRRSVRSLVIVVVALGCGVGTARAQVEMIVKAREATPLSTRLNASAKGAVDDSDPLFRKVLSVERVFGWPESVASEERRAMLINLADSADLRDALSEWSRHPDIAYAQANGQYFIDVAAPDPLSDSLNHFSVIDVPGAWELTRGDATVRVGFVDTGVFREHPDLQDQFWINRDEDLDGDGRFTAADLNGFDDDANGFVDDVSGYDFVDRHETVEQGDFRIPDPDPADDGSGHGTSVAGIIGAALENDVGIAGIAPRVQLVPLRAFGRDGRGEDDDIARAIVYAADMRFEVINLSFGDTHISPLMQDAIRYATDRGVVIVASAGNTGGDRPHYPSDYAEVISVVWLDASGAGLASRATHGVGVDIGAPGSSIFTTVMPSNSADTSPQSLYGRRSGSSMAAPMVSAAAALIRSIRSDLGPQSVRSILTGSARDIDAIGWDHRTGSGLLQVGASVRRALPARVEITTPRQDQGFTGGGVVVRGSATDPSFASYELLVAEGQTDLSENDWMTVGPTVQRQVWNGDLGEWSLEGVAEGHYTLRLRVNLRSGKSIEDRRRITVDRTEPQLRLLLVDDALVRGRHGIAADVESDDISRIKMDVSLHGTTHSVVSDRVARRHGLQWLDESLLGGVAHVVIRATNQSGIQAERAFELTIPRNATNAGEFEMLDTQVRDGFLLPSITDFDGDGLNEILFNQYDGGWLGDTLKVYEWSPTGLRQAAEIVAAVFPRDIGDTNGNGRTELLTQVGAATLLIEQESGGYPSNLVFVDTTGLEGNTLQSLWGAFLTDLDGDGNGEIVGHNTREWRILEWNGSTYAEAARLTNPTSIDNSELSENSFEQPQGLVGDLDEDGRTDLVVGDGDGDWIWYEASGQDQLEVVWTYETNRYSAGSRWALGDLDGDGAKEFVSYTQNWLATTSSGEREPDLGVYYVFSVAGDNQAFLADSISVPGEISRHGSLAAADLDSDGNDELIIVNPPDLYILSFDAELKWRLRDHLGLNEPVGFSGVRSAKLAVGDLDSDGAQDLVFGTVAGTYRVLRARNPIPTVTTPNWISAYAVGQSLVRLEWLSPETDSVSVLRGVPGDNLDPIGSSSSGMIEDSVTTISEYALLGWSGGVSGEISRSRTVRPHRPGVLAGVDYGDDRTVELTFTEPLSERTRRDLFRMNQAGVPDVLVLTHNGMGARLQFRARPGTLDTLAWTGLVDKEGTPMRDSTVVLTFPDSAPRTLIVVQWQILSSSEVRIVFSQPLDRAAATALGNYRLQPSGEIVAVDFEEAAPDQVVLRVKGRAIGPTGLETTVSIVNVRGADGSLLAPEGNTIRLTAAASDLADVFVFPNPFRRALHGNRLRVGGLPTGARIQVFTGDGVFVRDLTETDGDGGVQWDLTDTAGRQVPSGIYLLRVTAEGMGSTLKKAAVIN